MTGYGRERPLSPSSLNGSLRPFAFSNVLLRSFRQSTLSTVQPPLTIRELSAQIELSIYKTQKTAILKRHCHKDDSDPVVMIMTPVPALI